MEVSKASGVPQYSQLEVNPESLYPEVVPHQAYDIKNASTTAQSSAVTPRLRLRRINSLWIVLVVVVVAVAALVGGLVGGLHKPPRPTQTG